MSAELRKVVVVVVVVGWCLRKLSWHSDCLYDPTEVVYSLLPNIHDSLGPTLSSVSRVLGFFSRGVKLPKRHLKVFPPI
jgi:hypothetical protein